MKLLISDLDGTLYPKSDFENKDQFENNVKAIQKWVNVGNKFAVATARGIHHHQVLSEKLGFYPDFIGANGAQVAYSSGKIINKTMSVDIFMDLCRFIKQEKINASIATGIEDEWVWSSSDCYPMVDSEIYQKLLKDIKIVDLDKIYSEKTCVRIQVFTPPEQRDELKDKIISRNYPSIITTSDVDLIDLGPLNSSKGISIMELCQEYGVKSEDIIVIGDSENDVAMFEITKHSYCISHAAADVLEKANTVVKSVEEVIELELNKI